MRPVAVFAALAIAVVLTAPRAGATAHAAAPTVSGYPSAQTIKPSGPLPAGAGSAVALNTAIGEQEDAVLVVAGARRVAVAAPTLIGPLPVRLFFAHFVRFGGKLVPDALFPWDGSARQTEQPNQPIWLQVTVPYGTMPGTYTGVLGVSVDAATTLVHLTVHVFDVTLPRPGQLSGSLMTSFLLSAQTYVNAVAREENFTQGEQYRSANVSLYRFLASYRIAPSSWGYGDPIDLHGYTSSGKWWLDAAGNMIQVVGGHNFAPMRLPISNNRTTARNYIAGLSPDAPERWCDYLKAIRGFWGMYGWLDALPYVYGQDEPGLAGFRLVARQAAALHTCFPGGKELVTGNPSRNNQFLWDGRGGDDVDIWTVVANRYYGEFTVPRQQRLHHSRAREKLALLDTARSRGAQIWVYTYPGTHTPGFDASEPLSDGRMLFLWSALEGIQGVLYAENLTAYGKDDPLTSVGNDGAFVLVYPGAAGPMPSARLEQIRDGIEDWELLAIVRARHGAATVRRILGDAGLFSASASGVKLACTIGCDLHGSTPFSWPSYSHDVTTAARIERAKLAALTAAR